MRSITFLQFLIADNLSFSFQRKMNMTLHGFLYEFRQIEAFVSKHSVYGNCRKLGASRLPQLRGRKDFFSFSYSLICKLLRKNPLRELMKSFIHSILSCYETARE